MLSPPCQVVLMDHVDWLCEKKARQVAEALGRQVSTCVHACIHAFAQARAQACAAGWSVAHSQGPGASISTATALAASDWTRTQQPRPWHSSHAPCHAVRACASTPIPQPAKHLPPRLPRLPAGGGGRARDLALRLAQPALRKVHSGAGLRGGEGQAGSSAAGGSCGGRRGKAAVGGSRSGRRRKGLLAGGWSPCMA